MKFQIFIVVSSLKLVQINTSVEWYLRYMYLAFYLRTEYLWFTHQWVLFSMAWVLFQACECASSDIGTGPSLLCTVTCNKTSNLGISAEQTQIS